VLAAAAVPAITVGSRPIRHAALRLAGAALVAEDSLTTADVIIVPEWAGAVGALEAADLQASILTLPGGSFTCGCSPRRPSDAEHSLSVRVPLAAPCWDVCRVRMSHADVVGFITDDAVRQDGVDGLPVLGDAAPLRDTARLEAVAEIVLAVDGEMSSTLIQALVGCQEDGIDVVQIATIPRAAARACAGQPPPINPVRAPRAPATA
jgi:hypothetical protein